MTSKFQQRHYEALAQVMQESAPKGLATVVPWEEFRNRLSDLFASDNAQFDRGRFERACVPGANVRARTK